MTAAAFQSLGISDDMKERLNRLVIGVATMEANNFRKRGSSLAQLICKGPGFAALSEHLLSGFGYRRLGRVAAGSCWPRLEMLVEVFDYHGFIGGDRVT